jgi:hypothetical protein|tara:strand:+ start:696 stop:971 length:276 start_codon:yes stop_codon:yes gene_type:complete
MKTNIKNLKFGDQVKFIDHHHVVFNDEIDCSNMYGSVVSVDSPTEKDKRQSIVIKLKSKKYKKELFHFENCVSFNFPDEEHYNDVEVNLIK